MAAHGLVATWNGVASSSIPELIVTKVQRGGFGAVRDVTVAVPGRDGSWLFTENRGMRKIVADCTIVSDNIPGRRATIVEAADWLDIPGRFQLKFSDQPDRYWDASIASDITPDEWKRLGKFSVEWDAQPYAYALTVSSESASATVGTSSLRSFIAADTIRTDAEIVLQAVGGTMTSAAFTLNGDTISWAGTVLAGASLTISGISSTITSGVSADSMLIGAFDPLLLVMSQASGLFGEIIPGTNQWQLTTTGTATRINVTIRWRRKYR